jgi:outer membrane protein assembly factor BamB
VPTVRSLTNATALLLLLAGCGGPIPTPAGSGSAGSPSASPVLASSGGPANPAAGEWSTYMADAARSGVGPASPVAGSPHRTWTARVDGDVYAEPLVTGTTVIVATEQDSVYALDAKTGSVTWRTHLGEPVPLSQLGCGNIDPNGVTSTPVLDPSAGFVYAVAILTAPLRHELFALRLSDGGVAWHRVVDPPGSDPRFHQQRGSLNLSRGRVYFTYGGFTGDCGEYHGWVVSAATSGSGPIAAWQVPSNNLGAIWAPPGPVISAAGDVWVSTGNTELLQPDDTLYDGSNAIIRLDPGLTGPIEQWAPRNWAFLNRLDIDLASMAPALLPGGLVFVTGKEGQGYLLRQDHLNGIGGEVFKARVCTSGGPTGGAFGGSAVGSSLIYVPCKDALTALRISPQAPSFAVAWRTDLYANSPVLAYGLLWTVAADVGGYRGNWRGTLVALDPGSGAVKARLPLGPIPHFPSPAAAGGALYIAGQGAVYAIMAA